MRSVRTIVSGILATMTLSFLKVTTNVAHMNGIRSVAQAALPVTVIPLTAGAAVIAIAMMIGFGLRDRFAEVGAQKGEIAA